jgi:N-acetylmuramoyl-L-alanine amidase
MYKIALACGHNKAKASMFAVPDQGASYAGRTEYGITRELVSQIARKGIPGFEIVVVPEGLGIDARCKYVNGIKNLNMLMEFHLDAATPSAKGCTTYYVSGNDWAQNESREFQREYTRVTGISGRGVKGDMENRWGRLGAIRDVNVFALLVELGFITNASDVAAIIEKGAEAISAGIVKMFSNN